MTLNNVVHVRLNQAAVLKLWDFLNNWYLSISVKIRMQLIRKILIYKEEEEDEEVTNVKKNYNIWQFSLFLFMKYIHNSKIRIHNREILWSLKPKRYIILSKRYVRIRISNLKTNRIPTLILPLERLVSKLPQNVYIYCFGHLLLRDNKPERSCNPTQISLLLLVLSKYV